MISGFIKKFLTNNIVLKRRDKIPTKKEVKYQLKRLYSGKWSIHAKHNKYCGDEVRLNDSYVTTISLSNDSMQKILARAVLGMSWMKIKPIKLICQLKIKLDK